MKDKNLTSEEINSILQLSNDVFAKFVKSLFDVASETNATFTDAILVAREFLKQELSFKEVIGRTRDALILRRLSGVELLKSIELLNSVHKNFSQEAFTTSDILNRIIAADSRSAVSSGDLIEGVLSVGQAAKSAGVSFDELLNLIAKVRETTGRSSSIIGNSLKTIFARLSDSYLIRHQLAFAGVPVGIHENISTMDLLKRVVTTYKNATPLQKQYLAEVIGGVYQMNVIKAILSNTDL